MASRRRTIHRGRVAGTALAGVSLSLFSGAVVAEARAGARSTPGSDILALPGSASEDHGRAEPVRIAVPPGGSKRP